MLVTAKAILEASSGTKHEVTTLCSHGGALGLERAALHCLVLPQSSSRFFCLSTL